ncbi:unnamed protein product [Dicrocoelium dendriticum]|nr:unnamed protein product [Dicrocoelium dendriticum]
MVKQSYEKFSSKPMESFERFKIPLQPKTLSLICVFDVVIDACIEHQREVGCIENPESPLQETNMLVTSFQSEFCLHGKSEIIQYLHTEVKFLRTCLQICPSICKCRHVDNGCGQRGTCPY